MAADLSGRDEEQQFLQRSIDDLDREHAAGDLDDDDHRELRADYVRRLETLGSPPSPRLPAGGRRAGSILVVAAIAVAAGIGVASWAGTRAPGDALTGDIRESTTGRLQDAAQLAGDGDYVEALRIYDELVEDDAANVEALAERGLLLVSLSQATKRPSLAAEGRRSVERALALEPDNPRSLFYLGLALRLEGDDAGADAAFDRALAAGPSPGLARQIEQFRSTGR